MKKVIIFVKRKPGMSREAFREYYEARHAFLGPSILEGVLSGFGRYYIDWTKHLAADWKDVPREMAAAPEVDCGFDAVGIYTLRDDSALQDFARIMSDVGVARVIIEDEQKFMDRPACLMGLCDAVEGVGMISDEGHVVRARLDARG
jgi:EthD domain